ncbi:MAG: IS110 family transposase [Sphaerochaeta sp.]|jgi:transposase|uniref:IS110 family transposase n=1 Tax=Sphaerochaeta sp. TaxID=1972642 RepID=UPI002A364797|nr:IS110 family transposase [Sphaerochaeta sp.]MDD2394168.1 IS110 family transposase [Sphaerochaeta sp.]MDX9825023.1 IS110 family transposase [Sphaerochaeta sp.]
MPMNMQYERAFGLDLSKKTFHGCILDGPDLGSRHFFTGEMGQQGKAKLAGRLCKGDLVLMEAGTASFSLARFLLENTEAEVVVLNPAKLYNIFNSSLKNDKVDSEKIARIARTMPRDEWPTVSIPTKEEQAERSAVSLEVFLAREITMLVNRLYALFNSMGHPFIKKSDLKTEESRLTLANRLLCEDSLAIEQAIMLSDQIGNVTEQLEQCKQRLRDICLSHPKEALSLLSIPGIGLMTAASQIAFLGDGSRFDSPDSYVNYVGLSERRFDSGNKISKGHISHMGNTCIRRNIIQAAWVATKTSKGNPLARKYDDLRLRGKSKPVAAVAVAKKMIQLSYILVKSNGIYEFTKQQGLAAFRRRLQYHKLAQLLDFLPEITKRQMEEIDRTKRKEAAATTSRPKKFA